MGTSQSTLTAAASHQTITGTKSRSREHLKKNISEKTAPIDLSSLASEEGDDNYEDEDEESVWVDDIVLPYPAKNETHSSIDVADKIRGRAKETLVFQSNEGFSNASNDHNDNGSIVDEVQSLFEDIAMHEKHSTSSYDLVASNSFCSPQVRKVMGSSLMNSYCIGLPGNRFYGGCSEIDTIETKTRELVCDIFGSKHCEVQLLSGMLANIAAYSATLPKKGCTVLASSSKHGGHYSHNVGGPLTRMFDANIVQTPWDEETYNVDLKLLPKALREHQPSLLILGWSEMLFEHDLPTIKTIRDENCPSCTIMYDMSHVAGLVAGGVFQRDLMEHVDIVTSSTGKSLHSSDHGLVLYNDESFTAAIRNAVMPLLTSNNHFQEIAALYLTLLEMRGFGREYAKQVVSNTQELGKELSRRGFDVLCSENGYSKSHELIVSLAGTNVEGTSTNNSATEATRILDAAGIFVNPQELPSDTEHTGATGLRLGTQVLTRRGFKECDMPAVANAIRDVLMQGCDVETVASRIALHCSKFAECVSFTMETDDEFTA